MPRSSPKIQAPTGGSHVSHMLVKLNVACRQAARMIAWIMDALQIRAGMRKKYSRSQHTSAWGRTEPQHPSTQIDC